MLPWRDPSHDEGICPICQEHLKEATSTECGHLFCRGCLTQHVQKALASDVLCCPLCRKPCPECILGIGLVCVSHQKRASSFCEESRCLLCPQCLESPEHKSHSELTIENAISHYKVDCGNHWLETELGSQCQAQGQLDALSQQQLDQLEDTPAEVARILNLSRAIMQLSSLVTDLERTVKELDANTLKECSTEIRGYSSHAGEKGQQIIPGAILRVLTCLSLSHLRTTPAYSSTILQLAQALITLHSTA
ncbi:E3 ubiquitin ligase TRIM40 isoform X4 [Oryctolagus cuniculus]|uniref:E3 ubiquitin ligase TRIM40 isoform X4 n=1 Tax=Oryctolagus cuniculus TaxID=9986 RepID=UPI003879F92A